MKLLGNVFNISESKLEGLRYKRWMFSSHDILMVGDS